LEGCDALIPTSEEITIGQDYEIVQEVNQPSLTYFIDFNTGRIVGMVDGAAAVKQAVYMILQTERFDYLILSWNYGVEMNSLIGMGYPVFESEAKRRIREALLQDERIKEVTDFKFKYVQDKRSVLIEFSVNTVFGNVQSETEVTTNV
jgi:hypothetical protein